KQARLVFADRGPIDTNWDPHLLSRGLVSHGIVTIYGAEVTPFLPLARHPERGDTQLVLQQSPVNWKKGDRLVLTGTNGTRNQDEELTIVAIHGSKVTVSPAVVYPHVIPVEGLAPYVANVSRNVVLTSQNPKDLNRRGHLMFMHSPKVEVHFAACHD